MVVAAPAVLIPALKKAAASVATKLASSFKRKEDGGNGPGWTVFAVGLVIAVIIVAVLIPIGLIVHAPRTFMDVLLTDDSAKRAEAEVQLIGHCNQMVGVEQRLYDFYHEEIARIVAGYPDDTEVHIALNLPAWDFIMSIASVLIEQKWQEVDAHLDALFEHVLKHTEMLMEETTKEVEYEVEVTKIDDDGNEYTDTETRTKTIYVLTFTSRYESLEVMASALPNPMSPESLKPELAQEYYWFITGYSDILTGRIDVADRGNTRDAEDATDGESGSIPGEGESWDGGEVVPGRIAMPYYNQADARFNQSEVIPGKYVKGMGCGPTSLAMIITGLTGRSANPYDLAVWAADRGYYTGDGIPTSFFAPCAAEYGLSVSSIGTKKASILDALQAGKPVIALMGPGTFTSSGHYIVLAGIDGDGKIIVNDPGSSSRTGKTWDLDLIIRESKGYFAAVS